MARKSRKHAGLIGLGIIGSRVAAALRAGGFRTFVWNRTPKPEPNFLGSPAEVAEACEVVQLFVADADALLGVLDAMAPALGPAHVVVCNSTVGPDATLEAARMVEGRGAKFLDAPFTGSRAAAERRELTYYIGGDDETLKRAEPVLRASATNIVKIGTVGQAATMKVATNMLVGVTMQTLAEAYAVVRRSGIDPKLLGDALEHHAVRSGLMDMKLANLNSADFTPQFSLKHMFKDVQLAIQIANALDLDIPATTATAGVMYGALTQGWQDLDFSSVAKLYEENGGAAAVEVSTAVATARAPEEPVAALPEEEPIRAEEPQVVKAEPEAEAIPAPAEPEAADATEATLEKEIEIVETVAEPPTAVAEAPPPVEPQEVKATRAEEPPAENIEAPVSPAPAEASPIASAEASAEDKDEAPASAILPPPPALETPALTTDAADNFDAQSGAAAAVSEEIISTSLPAAATPPERPAPVFNRIRRWFGRSGA